MTAAPIPIGRFGPPRDCPTLATERLTLGPLTRDDWPDYFAFMASDRSCYMGGPLNVPTAWGWFCSDVAGWSLGGAGALAVRHKGKTVGQVSINDNPHFPEPELGWMLYDGWEGRGYATEAARAALGWLMDNARPASLVSYVDPDNAASIALAERLGATRDDDAATPDEGTLTFRHWGLA